jgi:hypothetical protein
MSEHMESFTQKLKRENRELRQELAELKRTPQIKRLMSWLTCRVRETHSEDEKKAYRTVLSKLRKGEFE